MTEIYKAKEVSFGFEISNSELVKEAAIYNMTVDELLESMTQEPLMVGFGEVTLDDK